MKCLSPNSAPAKRIDMRRRMILFLVLLSVFFGSTVAPAVAHADDGFAHATEVVDVHENEASVAGPGFAEQSNSEGNGSSPSAPFHHHCTCATEINESALDVTVGFSSQMFPKRRVAVMPSRRSAPPTEPPSA